MVTGGAGQITISNLTAHRENIQIIGAPTEWRTVAICDGDCSDPVIINDLESGEYFVKLNVFGNDNTYCYTQVSTTVTQGGSGPGPCTDLDNDGVCAAADCNDQNDNLPATPGAPCNDGNASTSNDVIQADGCTCEGETSGGGGSGTGDCEEISVTATGNDISVTGLSAPIEVVKLYRVLGGWNLVDQCIASCGDQQNFGNLDVGNYIVEVQLYDASWGAICNEQFNVAITSSLTDPSATSIRLNPTEVTDIAASKTFSLYPNPAQQSFWLNLNAWESQTLKVTIINHLSQPIFQQQIQHHQGQAQEIILPSIKNGIYFIQITNGIDTATEKLSVAK